MVSNDEKINLLIKRIKYAPSREWINSYFGLVKRIIDITDLKNDDPRLVTSLSPSSSGWHFPLSINNRYVVAIRKRQENGQARLFIGLIFSSWAREIPQLKNRLIYEKQWQFQNLRGEYSEPPFLLRFENLPELLYELETSEQVFQCWTNALIAECNRAKASPYRQSHEPLMYKMAVDLNFRADILNLVYADSKPDIGLLPEQIENPKDFYEGASKAITVNAYERSPQARKSCIEHYGARCIICGIDFQEKYGDIGKGFIHVHHIKPLGEIGATYKVNPLTDLCPVCPNCHAMIHMRKPPYSISELKSMLKN